MQNGMMVVCSVYDSKAEAWLPPMHFQSKGQAWRSFSDEVNRADSEFGKHPEDYALFVVGEWNPFIGELMGCVAEVICKGVDVEEIS